MIPSIDSVHNTSPTTITTTLLSSRKWRIPSISSVLSRKKIYRVLTLLLTSLILWYSLSLTLGVTWSSDLEEEQATQTAKLKDEEENKDLALKKLITNTTYVPAGYAAILEGNGGLESETLRSRCSTYFHYHLLSSDPTSSLSSQRISQIDFTPHELELLYLDKNTYVHTFKLRHRQQLDMTNETELDQFVMDDAEFDELMQEEGRLDFWGDQWLELNARFNQSLIDMKEGVAHLRAYDACHLKDKSPLTKEQDCRDFEKRLFPWLSGKLPVITDHNGEVVSSNPQSSSINSDCFIKVLRDGYYQKGSGISITISSDPAHLEELTSLILVLRTLDTRLPLQIIHNGTNDLSHEAKSHLIQIARLTNLNLDLSLDLKSIQGSKKGFFPPLDLSFVDIQHAITAEYWYKFQGYGMKLLALIFSSYEDVVLMDSDTVPFVNLEKVLLRSREYKQYGALFFQDRALNDTIKVEQRDLLYSLLPSALDSLLFNVDDLHLQSLKENSLPPLFSSSLMKHHMESGLLLLNKKKHFTPILNMLTLQLWDPITSIIYGDKELFWLGFVMSGEKDGYFMNPLPAGAIGELKYVKTTGTSTGTGKKKEDNVRKICSTHPVHVSPWDNRTPLWMNSGFSNCKKAQSTGLREDLSLQLYRSTYHSTSELSQHYASALKITGLIIPPPQSINARGWPGEGWITAEACDGLMFCAYDRVSGVLKKTKHGINEWLDVKAQLVVEFDERERRRYQGLSAVWQSRGDIIM